MNSDYSIIIPTYNREKELPRAIKSVLAQTSTNWDLIIIDDGSKDATKKIIEPYLKDERVKYYYIENSGKSAARNYGIINSSSPYIIFLDSDDELEDSLIENLTKFNKGFDLIFWQTIKHYKSRTEIWKPKKLEKIYNEIHGSFLAGSVCYKKSLLISAGMFDVRMKLGQNYELGIRISQIENLKTFYIKKPYLNYYLDEFKPDFHSPIVKEKMRLLISSCEYSIQKHKGLYKKDSYSYSRIFYRLGFLNEKLEKHDKANYYYRSAWKIDRFYWKPIAKLIIYYTTLRFLK